LPALARARVWLIGSRNGVRVSVIWISRVLGRMAPGVVWRWRCLSVFVPAGAPCARPPRHVCRLRLSQRQARLRCVWVWGPCFPVSTPHRGALVRRRGCQSIGHVMARLRLSTSRWLVLRVFPRGLRAVVFRLVGVLLLQRILVVRVYLARANVRIHWGGRLPVARGGEVSVRGAALQGNPAVRVCNAGAGVRRLLLLFLRSAAFFRPLAVAGAERPQVRWSLLGSTLGAFCRRRTLGVWGVRKCARTWFAMACVVVSPSRWAAGGVARCAM